MLFLGQTLPYPADSGANIRTFNVLRQLAAAYDITGLFFYRRATHPSPADVGAALDGIREYATADAFPLEQELSRWRFVWDHFRSVAAGRPYTWYLYESRRYRTRLNEVLADSVYDVVHVDSLDLSSYLPSVIHLPVVCVHHNVESTLLGRRAAGESSTLKKQYMHHQASLMRKEERRWCGKVDLNVLVSAEDESEFKSICPEARTLVVPNGVDTQFFQPSSTRGDGLVFVGPYSWLPNRDAFAFFCESVLPLIRVRHPRLRVTWIGRAPDSARADFERRHGVELTGYVDDIRPHVRRAAVYIVPLRIGGGTRLKILDAWALGMPVVSTSTGCEGLEAVDNLNIIIRDTPEAFATGVCELLEDLPRRERIGAAARQTAVASYDWRVIGGAMLPAYRELSKQPE